MSSIALATLMLVSLFAVVSSPVSVSGQASGTTVPLATNPVDGTRTGTGPGASTSFTTGQTEIFAVDANGALWNTSMAPSGNGTWNFIGGMCTSSPAVVSWNSSYFRVDVFVRGSNGAIWWNYYQNGWHGWNSLGGQAASGTGPAVASWSAGRLDVFVQGTDGALWHKWWNGSKWSGWESLGGKLTSTPAATSSAANNIYVFARGTDGAVWQKYWNGRTWSSWESLGGQVAPNTGPAASHDLGLFVQGTDNQLWHKSPSGSGWSTLAGKPPEALSTASPAAVLLPSDNTLVCVTSTSRNVWYSADSLANWHDWGSAGTPAVINATYRPELTQGIATDGTYNYGISNYALYKYDANWNLIMTNGQAAAQCGGNHIGAGEIYNGTLYVLCTENSPAPELAYVGLFNTSHLSFIKRVDLTKVAGNPPTAAQMNIGAVGVNPDAGLLLGLQFGPYGSTTPTPAEVFTFNLTTFAYEGHIQASNFSTIYNQGISYYDGYYYYSYDNPGGVAIMNADGSNATQIISASRMVAGEIEGLYVTNGNISVLCGGYIYTFPFQATGWSNARSAIKILGPTEIQAL
ncbi:MAG: hypothetical protein ABSE80_10765 [Halobacteriota archaeon]